MLFLSLDGNVLPNMHSKSLLLVSGDVLALLAFAAAGRANHGAGEVFDVETLNTALPFLIGRRVLPPPTTLPSHTSLRSFQFPYIPAHLPHPYPPAAKAGSPRRPSSEHSGLRPRAGT